MSWSLQPKENAMRGRIRLLDINTTSSVHGTNMVTPESTSADADALVAVWWTVQTVTHTNTKREHSHEATVYFFTLSLIILGPFNDNANLRANGCLSRHLRFILLSKHLTEQTVKKTDGRMYKRVLYMYFLIGLKWHQKHQNKWMEFQCISMGNLICAINIFTYKLGHGTN